MKTFFSQVKAIHYETKKDFTEEYIDIFKELKAYEKKKDKIMKAPLLPIMIRIGLGVIIILVLIIFPNAIPNDGVRLGLIMLAGVGSAGAATFISRTSKKRDNLDKLKLEYEDTLVCPKCNASLINHTLTYLLGRGRCVNSRCDATYDVDR